MHLFHCRSVARLPTSSMQCTWQRNMISMICKCCKVGPKMSLLFNFTAISLRGSLLIAIVVLTKIFFKTLAQLSFETPNQRKPKCRLLVHGRS